ncbi:MAG: large subunit ribosomal protein L6 [Alphaproteobacteria bacterium]|jgi:large subunit ribosomal protein L6
MSRLSKKPILLPKDVSVTVGSEVCTINGNLGSLNVPNFPFMGLSVNDNQIEFNTENPKKSSANAGLLHSLLKNAIAGVTLGHVKILELKGLGYRCLIEKDTLILSLGYSHKIHYLIPSDIKLTVEKDTIITIKGIDKQRVGQVAAEIRAYKIPDNYHAKGILYQGEIIITKEGKKK